MMTDVAGGDVFTSTHAARIHEYATPRRSARKLLNEMRIARHNAFTATVVTIQCCSL